LLLGQADEGAANFMGASIALGQFSAVLTGMSFKVSNATAVLR
jgi:hypothetical protein